MPRFKCEQSPCCGALPVFPPRLVTAAVAARSTPDPSSEEGRELQDALREYAHALRDAGVGHDDVIPAIRPLFVGITDEDVINDAVGACFRAYEEPHVLADRERHSLAAYVAADARRAS